MPPARHFEERDPTSSLLHFCRTAALPVSAEEAFAFHLDPANLGRISPPWVPVVRMDLPSRIVLGAELRLRVRVFWVIPQAWRVRITQMECSTRLVDEALEGPFPFWRHIHSFQPREGGGCLMTDRVEYLPPLGRFGRWVDRLTTRPMLAAMFRYRHGRTRALMEAANPSGASGESSSVRSRNP